MIPGYSLDRINNFVGRELGLSDWLIVDQEKIEQFAECTGDFQWIHVDVERCRKEGPFGAPIAHGFLSLSLLAALQMQLGCVPTGVRRAINAGVDQVKFQAPVLAGTRVRARVKLLSAEAKGDDRMLLVTRNVLEIEGNDKPALTANLIVMVYP